MSVIDEIKNKAKANKKTVVLPETTDMRTLTAAAEVISEGIADIILVGKEDEIKAKAEAEGLDLSKASFVDPENCDHLNTYIESLCEARKSKGLLPEDAKEILLSNPLFFGATMVRHMEDFSGERQQRAENSAHDAEDGDPFENQSKIHISALLSRSSCRRSP